MNEDEAWEDLERQQDQKKKSLEGMLFDAIREDNKRRQVGIMFALPMFGGMCHGDFALSLVRTVNLLTSLGFRVNTQAMFNESLITRARNNLARTFIQDATMDMMMFIDSDICFTEHDVLKLILADKDFVGGVYPRKTIHWDAVAKAAVAGKTNPEDWACSYLFRGVEGQESQDGLIEVTHAATGFLLLRRPVFTKMMPLTPCYEDVIQGNTVIGWDFFRVGVGDNGKYTSEDYWFCNEYRKAGGSIFVNPYLKLGHIGTWKFDGNLARMGSEPL